jgi:hypothetical protein
MDANAGDGVLVCSIREFTAFPLTVIDETTIESDKFGAQVIIIRHYRWIAILILINTKYLLIGEIIS